VVGSTATGKSALALALSAAVPGVELVNVDALQVYRGMDVGTAKASSSERAAVPHHLLDLIEPSEEMSVVAFQQAYDEVLAAITRRGAVPVLVGGTGLYVRVVIDRLQPPGSWPDLRAELEARAGAELDALVAQLAALDPAAAAKIEPGNARRVVRALEVCLGSGRPFSSYGPGLDTYPPTHVVQVGLRLPRAALTERIERRFRSMLDAGWLDEVRGLLERPGGLSRTARQALGYAELIDHLEGRCTLDVAGEAIVARTRRFAIRQERWFRRDPRIRWFELDPAANSVDIVPAVLQAWSQAPPAALPASLPDPPLEPSGAA
jgi:tRNA dimethylallyltransferase